MINIEIWSDFACPFCYAGEFQLTNAINELGVPNKVDIKFKAFELDHKKDNYASSPTREVFMNKFHMSKTDAERQVKHEQQLVRSLGLECNYEDAHPSNTRDAHRLMKLAEEQYGDETVRKLSAALFNAYLVRSKVLANRDVLIQAGLEAGIKKSDIISVLDSNRYVDAVIDDERRAESYGVTGVPYFLINGKMAVPGAISTRDFKELLNDIIENDKKRAADMQFSGAHPHRCTDEGCELL